MPPAHPPPPPPTVASIEAAFSALRDDDEEAETFVIPRPGLKSIDLGHGRTKPAVPIGQGDALGRAAERDDLVKVRKLLGKGVDANVRNPGSGVTPLGVAAERGHDDVVKALLAANADVAIETTDGMTPLHIACQFGRSSTIKVLLAANSDVDSPSPGSTPLIAATASNSLDTMTVLIEAHADINRTAGSDSETPLHVACRMGNTGALRLLLLTGKADVKLRNALGEMPIEVAMTSSCARRFQECACMLRPFNVLQKAPGLVDKSHSYVLKAMKRLGRSAEMEMVGNSEDSVVPIPVEIIKAYLRAAAAMGNIDAIKELGVTHQDCINDVDSNGHTPLHHACEHGHMGCAAALISRGAEVNKTTADGSTALHLACKGGHPMVVRVLLNKGAEASVRDDDGLSPSDLAGPDVADILDKAVQTPALS